MAKGRDAHEASDAAISVAFLALVIVAGGNAVAIRYTSCKTCELDPFWGAASRFLLGSVIFTAIASALRTAWLQDERITRGFAAGSALVLGGVYFGALRRSLTHSDQ
jgi:drug/metabolite transporter (DMT)-like permease